MSFDCLQCNINNLHQQINVNSSISLSVFPDHMSISILTFDIEQRGPITFDPRATLQKHDDLRAISNKILQDQKLNKNRFRFASSIYKEQIHKISNKTNSKDK